MTELRKRVDRCEFAELKNSLIRDKIVIGICDKKTQERLLGESELSLEKALQICRAAEEIKMKCQVAQRAPRRLTMSTARVIGLVKGQININNWPPPDRKRQCIKCLKYHDPAEDPAYNQKCHKCGHLGHYAVACRSKVVREVVADKEQSTENDDSETEFYIGTIKADIVNVNCERDTNMIDHTASTDTVISRDNKSETMSTQNNVDVTENEHTDILNTEDNTQESTNVGVHNEETLTENEHTDILSTEAGEYKCRST